MTATIFGQEYDMLGSEEHRCLVKDIQRSNVRMSVLYNDNIFRFLRLDRILFPKSIAGRRTFLHYIQLFLANSSAGVPSSTRDKSNLFHLLKTVHDPESGRQLRPAELRAEAATLIAAGMCSLLALRRPSSY